MESKINRNLENKYIQCNDEQHYIMEIKANMS